MEELRTFFVVYDFDCHASLSNLPLPLPLLLPLHDVEYRNAMFPSRFYCVVLA